MKVQDDYGIRKARIHFSVNGDSEREVELNKPSGSRSFVTSHTFYLEEFGLLPGDFVSYYAQAEDAISSSVTDIYFLEVEPYDREYYQSQNQGMSIPASGNEDLKLSKRQKEIIVATFKLRREQNRPTRAGFKEDIQTLAPARIGRISDPGSRRSTPFGFLQAAGPGSEGKQHPGGLHRGKGAG